MGSLSVMEGVYVDWKQSALEVVGVGSKYLNRDYESITPSLGEKMARERLTIYPWNCHRWLPFRIECLEAISNGHISSSVPHNTSRPVTLHGLGMVN